jgi:Zinc-binding domain of primase-helicase
VTLDAYDRDNGHAAEIAMLNAFASVGAERFSVTWTNLADEKVDFRRNESLADGFLRAIHFLPVFLPSPSAPSTTIILRVGEVVDGKEEDCSDRRIKIEVAMEKIHDLARNRWRDILTAVGLESRYLSGKNTSCPACGGTDRFRFIDSEGVGSFNCRQCGGGTGVELVMKFRRVDFVEAVRLIKSNVGEAKVVAPKATASDEKRRAELRSLWSTGKPLDGADVASRYLASRGIVRPCWPCLRWVPSLPHWEQGKSSIHPAMLARFVAPDDKTATLHATWLDEAGVKAAVDMPKKMLGSVPIGGAAMDCRSGLHARRCSWSNGVRRKRRGMS